MPYTTPARAISRILTDVIGFEAVAATDRFEEATPETVDAILTEIARLCDDVMAPLNRVGDVQGSRLENGVVRTPDGFAEAYRAIAEGGWVGLTASPEHGGMGLPFTLTTAMNDMMSGACLSLQLNPLLSQGQIEALEAHASDEIKETYLSKLIEGTWTGTMNLTEPQAGSDVGALRARAEPNGDGSYAITGQKIYISWADHDMAENIVHLVLARLPDAAPGTRGISLFVVPKRLPDAAGNAGVANSLKVVSLEHKMGLHASPTAVMEYEGATGWMVGEPHRGMAAMFTMMNNARVGVAAQGVGVAEAAYQKAVEFARERTQGKAGGTGRIIEHADVKRMLMEMKTDVFAARAILLACAASIDMATATGDAGWAARAAFLTPIAKAFGTDVGSEVSDKGVQVHGGMGYVEETGAAQFMRDARVPRIYEGTNGIQAMDLIGRKMGDGGETAERLLDEIEQGAEAARAQFPKMGKAVWSAAETLREATEFMVAAEMETRAAGAVPYLRAFARVLGAHYHLKAAQAGWPGAVEDARFYINRLLPEYVSLLSQVRAGDLGAITADSFAA